MPEVWELGVAELGDCYRSGKLSPVEVVEGVIDRCERFDGSVHALAAPLFDTALRDARVSAQQIAAGDALGPLHGVPVAVKELIDVAGAPVTYGSRVFAGRIASKDAAAVRALRVAGAIIVGVTRSHEFGWGITTRGAFGGTTNPWDASRIAGGSSGGSAAAVAARMVPAALGTDTGGSVRIPAAFCGVMGLKPTYGAASTDGIVPLAPSLDHVGCIARTPGDLAILVGAIAHNRRTSAEGAAGQPATQDRRPLERARLGLVPDLNVPPLAHEYQRIFDAVVDVVAAAGSRVLTFGFKDGAQALSTFTTIQRAEAHYVHTAVLGTFPGESERYGDDVRLRLEAAREIDLRTYLSAQTLRAAMKDTALKLLAQVDVLVTPLAACPPSPINTPDVGEYGSELRPLRDLVMGYTAWQDLLGLPVCNVPVAFDSLGLPVSVQLTGAPHTEPQLLAFAAELQRLIQLPTLLPTCTGGQR